jgi:hypothetical protein
VRKWAIAQAVPAPSTDQVTAGRFCMPLALSLKIAETSTPSADAPVISAKLMKAAINAYSMDVAPASQP